MWWAFGWLVWALAFGMVGVAAVPGWATPGLGVVVVVACHMGLVVGPWVGRGRCEGQGGRGGWEWKSQGARRISWARRSVRTKGSGSGKGVGGMV